eukprot:3882058-Pleurochrysis_carterae.AAC.1
MVSARRHRRGPCRLSSDRPTNDAREASNAEATVAAPGAADESAGTVTAAPDVAVEATVTAPGAAEENADAANTALDVAANLNSAAPSAAAEDADA